MLNFILGRIGSGKTTSVHNKIKTAAQSGKNIVLIVPEQDSFQTEKDMLLLLGARSADMAEVVSFSFLARNILKKYGLNTKSALDDSTRAVMMSLALESVKDDLNVYSKRHSYSAFVIAQILKTIKELRQCSVSTQMLRDTAAKMEPSLLKSKLEEIALITDAYEALTQQSFSDDECALDALYKVLVEHAEFKNKTVFIDGFRGYTSQQFKVLEMIFAQSEETYVTVCSDGKMSSDDFGSFAHTKRTIQKLKRIADKNNLRVAKPEYLEEHNQLRYNNDELPYLEKGLYSDSYEIYSEKTEHITICSAEDFESECEYVAHIVKNLIRTENLRCRDIAIISRSENNYARQLRAALVKNGVPVFEDMRQPVFSQPLIEFVCSALDVAERGFSVDSVSRIVKTRLTDLSIDEVSELENYVLLWKINGSKWLDTWVGHPNGLGEKMLEADIEKLEGINAARQSIVAPLQKFRLQLKDNNGLGIAKAIYNLLTEMNVAENLKTLAQSLNESGESELASEQNRIWEIVIEILDKVAYSLENVKLSVARFKELFNLIISTYTIGNIPQGLDEIVIGSADRVKTHSPKVVFAVGVNDTLFPMVPASSGVLSDNEKKKLFELELEIDDNIEQKMMEEHFIAYSTLCCPSDKLYVTYSRKDVSGAVLSNSELVTQIRRIFPNVTEVDTVTVPEIDYVEGDSPAFELMAKLKSGEVHDTLEKYFSMREDYAGKLTALERAIDKKPFEITDDEIAKKLFGMNMYMSASRTEVYHECPFEYFCKYGLSAKPRKVAELDPMQRGTALHYILEKIISAYGSDGLCKMTKEERDKCVKDILENYFEENLGSSENLGERFEYLFNQLGVVACEVVDRLVEEFNVSSFVPVAFELKIDNDGEVMPYGINLSDGGTLKIKGSVDRVDVMKTESETFVRVIDYKSGGKKFDLNEVFSGLNMQMLIYLFAIWKNGFREYKNVKPAGVLYMPVKAPSVHIDRDDDELSINKEKQKNVKMNGMVLDDSRVIFAMDSRGKKQIVPAAITENGECSGTLISLKQMGLLMKRVEKILSTMAEDLHCGKIPVLPAKAEKSSSPYYDVCKFCDYKEVCSVDENTPTRDVFKVDHNDSLKLLGGEDDA